MLQRQGKKQGRSPRSKLGQSYHGPRCANSVYHTADIRYSALWVQLFSDMRGPTQPAHPEWRRCFTGAYRRAHTGSQLSLSAQN